jgi:hypothetical protein
MMQAKCTLFLNGERFWVKVRRTEMVQHYAHLAPHHLTEHARQIDTIFGGLVPNLSHVEIEKLGVIAVSH